jgi:serine/threonine protein kinase
VGVCIDSNFSEGNVLCYAGNNLKEAAVLQVEREIRIHSRLQHANIVQLYASFEDNKYVYLVQEYAAGEPPSGYCQ